MKKTIISLVASIILASFSHIHAQSCWPTFRGDAQFSGTSNATLPSKLSLLWNFKTNDAIKASPVVCNGVIVIGSVDGNVYGITLEGTLKWKVNTGNGIEAPAMINNDIAYIGNLDGRVLAIELATGKTLWSYSTEGQIMGAPNFMRLGDGETGRRGEGSSSADDTAGEGIVVIGSYDYYLHGIDAKTGVGLWKYEADNFINGAAAIYEGVAIFGGCDGLLHQVNVKDGTLKSRQEVATYVAGSVAVDNWFTYVGDYDGKFTCLDLKNGKVLWIYKNEETDLPFIASPSVSADKVFIGSRDKFVYAFNKKTGRLEWKVNTLGRVDASPVLVNKELLVATMRGDIMLLNEKDGSTNWSYELGSPIVGTPAVIESYIIVAAEDGRIYCFGKK